MKAHVVIGANFGDEGKGLTTHYLCNKYSNVINIRFNGGAQAGHTTEISGGLRHIFKHFGSGTIVNTPTYLSEHFIVNPIEFLKEYNTLTQKIPNFIDTTYIHPNAKITTPYDIMINWAFENKRRDTENNTVHGSCGLGIHATIVRHNIHPICFADLLNPTILREKLIIIRHFYDEIIHRYNLHDYIDSSFKLKRVIEEYYAMCKTMLQHIHVCDYAVLCSYDNLIFEGA